MRPLASVYIPVYILFTKYYILIFITPVKYGEDAWR